MKRFLNTIYDLGVTPELSPDDKRKAQLINQIILYCGLAPIAIIPLVLVIADFANFVFISCSGVLLLSALFLSKSKNHRLALFYFLAIGAISLGLGSLLFQNSSTDIYFIPAATIPFLVLKKKREAIAIFILLILVFVGLNIAYEYVEPIQIFKGNQRKIAYVNSVVMISGMIFIVLYNLKRRNDSFESEIVAQKELVEEAYKEITDSINYAKRIQTAILPPKKLVKEYLQKSFILYKPKDVVAGDFYWIEQKNGKVLFAAADCTGHGVPGAMVSVICNNGLNRSVREYGLSDPGQILDKTREIVIQEFEKSEDEVKDGMDIALCSLEGNKLQYAGAHNPVWIIRNGEILETKANKQPIGQFDNPESYTTHSFDLEPGDSIYIFSDGYVDQFGGEKEKKFKAKAFRELLLSIQDKPMEEQKTILYEAFETWKGSLEQIDDVCVIGVRV